MATAASADASPARVARRSSSRPLFLTRYRDHLPSPRPAVRVRLLQRIEQPQRPCHRAAGRGRVSGVVTRRDLPEVLWTTARPACPAGRVAPVAAVRRPAPSVAGEARSAAVPESRDWGGRALGRVVRWFSTSVGAAVALPLVDAVPRRSLQGAVVCGSCRRHRAVRGPPDDRACRSGSSFARRTAASEVWRNYRSQAAAPDCPLLRW